MGTAGNATSREPWNKGKIVGQKAPFKVKDIWALRVHLQMEGRVRELALFNLGIDSKLRGCDLVALKVRDVCHGDQVATRAIVMQHKTQRPVQFEITQATREALQAWIKQASLKAGGSSSPCSSGGSLKNRSMRISMRFTEGWSRSFVLLPSRRGSGTSAREAAVQTTRVTSTWSRGAGAREKKNTS
jgi:hypothetical protein